MIKYISRCKKKTSFLRNRLPSFAMNHGCLAKKKNIVIDLSKS